MKDFIEVCDNGLEMEFCESLKVLSVTTRYLVEYARKYSHFLFAVPGNQKMFTVRSGRSTLPPGAPMGRLKYSDHHLHG